ncbi:MAG: CPBP family glutamic-type intramembrane protease [Acidimicrobiales bacterium]
MTAAIVVGVLVVHNLLTNLWFTDRWAWAYVPVNLATAGGLVWVAGAEVPMGAWRPGLAAAMAVVAAVAVVAIARPRWVADRRMAGVGASGTAYRALVRIPLGTVVLEEVAFRAVLPALLSPAGAAALFGLWHVAPAANALEVNGRRRRGAPLVAAAVVVTGLVGLVLWELRVATGGLAAPMLAHAAANSGATVAAYAVLRGSCRRGRPRS